MKKVSILALLLAIVMMASVGLATDSDPIVIKANDIEVPLSEVQAMYDDYYQQYVTLYAENGVGFTDADAQSLRDAVVDMMAQLAVLDGKVKEYGFDVITDADKEALRAEVEEGFNAELATYAASIGMSVEDTRELVAAQGATVDSSYEQMLEALPYNRLFEEIVKDVTVTDEDVQKEYQAYVDEDKAMYEGDIGTYEMYSTYYGSSDIYFVPEGFRYIKHILLANPDDVAAELQDLETDMGALQNEIDQFTDELYALENVDEAAETKPRSEEEIQADIDAKQAEYDALKAKHDETKAQILPSLQPIIDEISSRYAAGESFDALVGEFNTDPGVTSNPDGYKVHKDSVMWETNFRDAAMALAKPGDLSEPVQTDYGIHIILYSDDVPGGAVALTDAVAESLKQSLLSAKQDEAYATLFDQWIADSTIETHPELVVLPTIEPAAQEDALVPAEGEPEAPTAEDAAEDANADGSIG